jgi:hypothetical protein
MKKILWRKHTCLANLMRDTVPLFGNRLVVFREDGCRQNVFKWSLVREECFFQIIQTVLFKISITSNSCLKYNIKKYSIVIHNSMFYWIVLDYNCSTCFGPIFRLIFEQVWRWTYSWAETCSCNYNLMKSNKI